MDLLSSPQSKFEANRSEVGIPGNENFLFVFRKLYREISHFFANKANTMRLVFQILKLYFIFFQIEGSVLEKK